MKSLKESILEGIMDMDDDFLDNKSEEIKDVLEFQNAVRDAINELGEGKVQPSGFYAKDGDHYVNEYIIRNLRLTDFKKFARKLSKIFKDHGYDKYSYIGGDRVVFSNDKYANIKASTFVQTADGVGFAYYVYRDKGSDVVEKVEFMLRSIFRNLF